jgi:hypothetical protein
MERSRQDVEQGMVTPGGGLSGAELKKLRRLIAAARDRGDRDPVLHLESIFRPGRLSSCHEPSRQR